MHDLLCATGTAGGGANCRVMDLEGEVAAAAGKGALLWTLPWVNCYLWFLQPTAPVTAPLRPCMLIQLSQLRCPTPLVLSWPAVHAGVPQATRCLLRDVELCSVWHCCKRLSQEMPAL